jgi:hypothetical protein
MGKMNEVLRNTECWLKDWSFSIVLTLSILHVGLAYIHVRDSGGPNCENGSGMGCPANSAAAPDANRAAGFPSALLFVCGWRR